MELWTWQADEVKPTVGGIDPRGPNSYYDINPSFRPAFERLWAMFETDQLLWCFAEEEAAKALKWAWADRKLWSIDVPDDAIRATIDPGVWEFILGSGATPPCYGEIRDRWKDEDTTNRLEVGKTERRKLEEYHQSKPPRGDWWSSLFLNGPNAHGWTSEWVSRELGRDVAVWEVLVTRPVSECRQVHVGQQPNHTWA